MSQERSLETYREQAIELLSAGYTADQISVDEFERRLDLVNDASTVAEVREAVGDLPVVRQEAEAAEEPRLAERESSDIDQQIVTILSERKLTGDWLDDDRATSISFLGSSRIDLRDTALHEPYVPLNVIAIMGEAKIIVPPDMRIQNNITPLLAEVHVEGGRRKEKRSRTLRLSGFALMGEVHIVVKP